MASRDPSTPEGRAYALKRIENLTARIQQLEDHIMVDGDFWIPERGRWASHQIRLDRLTIRKWKTRLATSDIQENQHG